MGLGTVIFGLLSVAGLLVVGRLIARGLRSGRMVAFHYMGHEADWTENRIGYVTTTAYNLFWLLLSAGIFAAAILGRFQ
jgi:hypothetical protein